MAEACRVTALACVNNQLLYALATPGMGGLYLKDDRDDAAPEGNWYSDRGFRALELDAHDGKIALALYYALVGNGRNADDVILARGPSSCCKWIWLPAA
jgi:hypothetical protein